MEAEATRKPKKKLKGKKKAGAPEAGPSTGKPKPQQVLPNPGK